jgi:transposase-like protein
MATRRRHTPEQIIRKLAEGNKLLAGGAELDEVCRHLQISESTWHRWLAQYGGMKANDAKRLKELETENVRFELPPPWRTPNMRRREPSLGRMSLCHSAIQTSFANAP